MIFVTRKTRYALVSLAFLAERGQQWTSAREIAVAHSLPLPLLMNLLKAMQQGGLLTSVRGVRGGYRLTADPHAMSLYDLICCLEGQGKAKRCSEGVLATGGSTDTTRGLEIEAPVAALRMRLLQMLTDLKLSELVLPGRRIDVPAEWVRRKEKSPPKVAGLAAESAGVSGPGHEMALAGA